MGYLSSLQEKKKAKKKDKETLETLKEKRDLAIEFRKSTGWDDRCGKAWNYYYYGCKDDLSDQTKKVERRANYVFSNIEAIVPKMFDRLPGFQVLGRGEDDDVKSPLVEAVLKYKFDHALNIEEEMEDAVRDMLISGFGVFKICWDFVDKEVEEDAGGAKEKKTYIEKDDVSLKIVNPKNFYITAGDTRMGNADGFFEKMIVGIEDAKAKWGDDKGFDANHYTVSLSEDKENLKKAGAKTVVWEFHDSKTKKVYTFTDNDILDTRDWYDHGHFPYVVLPNYRGAHEFYGMSEVYQLEPLQDEILEIEAQQSEFRKRAINPKKVVMKGAIDDVNMQRLRNPKINVIEVTQPNAIQWEQPAMIGPDIYRMREQKKEDISLMTGQNEISRGGVEETVKTATGQAIVNDASQGRIRHKVRAMERAMKEILYQVHGLLVQFQDKEERVKITDQKENPYQNYTKEEIAGNYDFVIDIVESMPLLRERRGQMALQAYEVFKDDPAVDQERLKKKVMQLTFQDINAEDLIVEPKEEQEPPQEMPPQMPPQMPMMPQQGIPPMEAPQGAMPLGIPPGL